VSIVRPETILKWHRRLVARTFDGSTSRKKHCGPPVAPEIEELVLTMAKDNRSWGYYRIAGALRNLGHRISDQTVGNVLRRSGIGPAPERRRNTTWRQFIRQHKEALWASDFFTSEAWTMAGLTTFYVLFFIHIGSRRIVLGDITTSPHGEWMKQSARRHRLGRRVGGRQASHPRPGQQIHRGIRPDPQIG